MLEMPSSSTKSSPSPACYGRNTANGHGLSLTDFLIETELEQYEEALRMQLKILRVEHLKDVHESDLTEIGMSKPEQRRLMKAFQKYFPSSLARKFKQKVLHRRAPSTVAGSASWNNAGASTSSSSYSLRRCNSNEEASTTAVETPSLKEPHAADDSQAGDEEQHIIPASNIILCRQLGKGEFGTVWQGVWTTSAHSSRNFHRMAGPQVKIQVAVKQIMPQKMLSSSMDFVREAAIMHRIHHEHIVRFFGVVLDTQTIMLVTELAPSRSMAECLKEERSAERFSVVQLCDFAQQICSGMTYLEANRFIHRDLAARNILVFSTHKVKISDFGLSRALGTGEEYYRGNFNVNLKLPIAWCAPECINFLKFTSASDVWAYGVTLWEMFTYGFQPWAGLNGQQIFDTVNAPKMGRLECPDSCPSEYYHLMLKCWHHEPDKRPKFADILSILPTIEPERVITVKACQDGQLDHLQYSLDVVITVLDKSPAVYPDGHFWKGALKNGRTGLFLPTNSVAYLESLRPGMPATNIVASVGHKSGAAHHNHHPKSAGGFIRTAIGSIGGLTRRSAGKPGINGTFSKEKNGGSRPLISLPQNDLRHTGHLGLDGMCFGDVPTQVNGLGVLKSNPTKRAITPIIQGPVVNNSATQKQQQRFESYSSETACLLSPDDEDGGEENSSMLMRHGGSGGTSAGTDLDDVQPMSIFCGDSGGWLLDEVLEALDQNRSTGGGCTNVAARFSNEDGPEFLSSNTEPPLSPTSLPEEEEIEDEETSSDRKRLWLTASSGNKKLMETHEKTPKEKSVKPLSLADTKMLNDIDKLADKLSTKALDKERDRLHEERRKLGLGDDWNENGDRCRSSAERSPSPSSSDSMKRQLIRKFRRSSPANGSPKPTFTDSLAMKCDSGEMRISPEAENAYKTLIEGRGGASNSVLLPREERDDPQRPSVEEDHGDASATEDETNPLRMLRNEGANVVRRFNRQGSGRRQHLVEKPTPPVRKKFQDGIAGSKPPQDGKSTKESLGLLNLAHETNGSTTSSPLDQTDGSLEAAIARKPPPPPVPPRCSPRLDSNRSAVAAPSEKIERSKVSAPAIPPKPKFTSSPPGMSRKNRVDVMESENPAPSLPVTENGDKKRSEACPSFTLDDVNKYDLLNFVLSGLPESRKAEERRKLISLEEREPSPPSFSPAASNTALRACDRDSMASRKEILIEDDVVHV